LFLGYLMGIPFWWVARNCLPMWGVGMGMLLLMFFAVDYRNYLRAPRAVRAELAEPPDQWRIEGLGNVLFLAVILSAVFINRPAFLREVLMLAAASGSWFTTRKSIHQANHFNFHPINEVAILFIGIFATMMPALDWLDLNAHKLDNPGAAFFYWTAGGLSSALDNAPTYICFLKAVVARFGGSDPAVASLLGDARHGGYILAISVAAVFFGANTYIGNGPNFMVKAIADHQKVHVPGFLGYLFRYTLPFMMPMLLVVWWLFFRG
jgi:Na+/H+ antiporter NhaD/arsenite permease-like protein